MKKLFDGVAYYVFGANDGKGVKKYEIDNVDKGILEFLNSNTENYVAFGIEYTGTQFQYGVASCDLFIKNNGEKRISQDYKAFFDGDLLKYTERIIEIINRAVRA